MCGVAWTSPGGDKMNGVAGIARTNDVEESGSMLSDKDSSHRLVTLILNSVN
jgi:hypothetical protein